MAKSSAKNSGKKPASVKSKRKNKPKRNYRQIIISVLVGLALIAFILPDLMPLFSSPPEYRPSSSANNNKEMLEPPFTKEGELTLISAKTGETIRHIDIEKADNDMERAFGLMYRKSLPDNQGMLFLFNQSEPQSFYMKNTLIPLDIIFVDENKKITTIHQNTTPLSERSLPSNGNAQFVLEVRGGFCDQYGVKIGDLLEWQ